MIRTERLGGWSAWALHRSIPRPTNRRGGRDFGFSNTYFAHPRIAENSHSNTNLVIIILIIYSYNIYIL
jgi:hypothetical protein